MPQTRHRVLTLAYGKQKMPQSLAFQTDTGLHQALIVVLFCSFQINLRPAAFALMYSCSSYRAMASQIYKSAIAGITVAIAGRCDRVWCMPPDILRLSVVTRHKATMPTVFCCAFAGLSSPAVGRNYRARCKASDMGLMCHSPGGGGVA